MLVYSNLPDSGQEMDNPNIFFQMVSVRPGIVWRIGGLRVGPDNFIMEWNLEDLTYREIGVESATSTRKGFAFKITNAQGKEEVKPCLIASSNKWRRTDFRFADSDRPRRLRQQGDSPH